LDSNCECLTLGEIYGLDMNLWCFASCNCRDWTWLLEVRHT